MSHTLLQFLKDSLQYVSLTAIFLVFRHTNVCLETRVLPVDGICENYIQNVRRHEFGLKNVKNFKSVGGGMFCHMLSSNLDRKNCIFAPCQ